jgi:hypothetical protein
LPAARDRWAAIGLVSLVAWLCYGLLIPWLGFYRDDWYQLWAGLTFGPRSIVTLFSIDRPFMGYTYAATFYALRDSALAWQVYAVALRWIGALGALWLFRRLWPGRPVLTTSAALIFLVYPGFLQQPNANTFSNHLLGYTAEILSLAATAELLGTARGWRRIGLTVFAVAGALTCWLLYEYMIGLEGLRYILIGRVALKESGRFNRQWLRRFLVESVPFLIPLIVFLVWRLLIFRADRGSVDVTQVLANYGPSPLLSLLQRGGELVRDFVEAGIFGWFVPTYERLAPLDGGKILLALIPVATAVLVFLWYVRRRQAAASPSPSVSTQPSDPAMDLILLGSVTTLASLAPVILTGRDVRWSSAFDRYTLHATLGLAMLTVGLVYATIRSGSRSAVLAVLLGVSVLAHQANAYHWARFWDEQRRLWWQLAWRAPGLEEGTVLMVNLPSQRYFEDYEIWGPANLIYDPGDRSPEIAAEVIAEDTVPRVRLGSSDVRSMRVLIGIPRDYRETVVVDWPSRQACVHVLEGNQPEAGVTSSALVQSIAAYSRGDLIQTETAPARPPEAIFGQEPARDWCWYYQAAALARQQEDWAGIVSLSAQAASLGLGPADPSEWVPFFQGHVNVGDAEGAARVAESIRENPMVAQEICRRLAQGHFIDPAAYDLAQDLLCSNPG